MEKTADAFRTISEVAEDLDLPQHVLRFWETRFTQIRPLKRGGGRRYYRREDVDLLRAIRQLLYGEGYTIKGVQKILKEQGARGVVVAWRGGTERVPAEDLPVELPVELPVGAARDHAAPARSGGAPSASAQSFGFEDFDEVYAAPPAGREPAPLGPTDYKVLETLLVELDECERLLGNARRPAASQ
jgi:DNA-binding transcriptional MerR regulator